LVGGLYKLLGTFLNLFWEPLNSPKPL
jgi:hypothetical protein